MQQFSTDVQNEFVARLRYCNTCGKPKKPCDNMIKEVVFGDNIYRNLCNLSHRFLHDPAAAPSTSIAQRQFEIIKAFIHAKIKFIDDKNNKYIHSEPALQSKIAIAISEALDGESKESALKLITYLSGNKMSPQHMSPNAWKSSFGGEQLFRIRLDVKKKRWSVELNIGILGESGLSTFDAFYEYIGSHNLRGLDCGKVRKCNGCNTNCVKRTKKNPSDICHVKWENSNNETVDSLIKITALWKEQA